MSTNQAYRRITQQNKKQRLLTIVSMLAVILAVLSWNSGAETPMIQSTEPPTPIRTAVLNNSPDTVISTPLSEREVRAVIARHPTAEILNPLLWLGCNESNTAVPMGSGVVVNINDNQYLVTALHVIENCNLSPLIRFNGRWNSMDWRTVAVDKSNDVVVLQTDTILDPRRLPVRRAIRANLRSNWLRSWISKHR